MLNKLSIYINAYQVPYYSINNIWFHKNKSTLKKTKTYSLSRKFVFNNNYSTFKWF